MTDAERAALLPSDPEFRARYVNEDMVTEHGDGQCLNNAISGD